jgi:hypothetical protein
MSLTVPYEIKGWCPGVQRPMQSGDGLLVRVRPWAGAFTLEQAAGLADIAATPRNVRRRCATRSTGSACWKQKKHVT